MMQHRVLPRRVAALALGIGLLVPAVRPRASVSRTWAALYGGTGAEEMEGIRATADGGYIIVGSTDSYGDVVRGDAWILKLDVDGNVKWQKTYGGHRGDGGAGSYPEYVVRVIEDVDGNYVMASETYSFGASASDIWVLKLDSNGNNRRPSVAFDPRIQESLRA